MATRTTLNLSRNDFFVDRESMVSTSGRQIDWASVPSSYNDAGNSNIPHIPAGTVMVEWNVGQTLAGQVFPWNTGTQPANTTIIGLLASDASGPADLLARAESLSGYGIFNGGNVYENLLPDSTGTPKVLPTAIKTALNTAGRTTFRFETYADNRAG